MAPFRLAHLSDPHLGPLPDVRFRHLVSKRVFGYVNWKRNRATALGSAELIRLVADLEAQAPDHVAVTGDLVNIGLLDEILAALAWLQELGGPEKVSVVPGNHDAYVPGALGHVASHWGDYMSGDQTATGDAAPAPVSGFPYVRRRGDVAIIGASSALATAPLSARGAFREPQASLLADRLRQAGEEGLFRIVLIHHPPVDRLTSWHKRMIGSRHFLQVVRDAGAELVLHGHTHASSLEWVGNDSQVPVVCVPSASSTGSGSTRARYNLFEIERGSAGFRCVWIERGAGDGSDAVCEIARHVLA